jgi:hypothetical protein
MKKGTSKPRDKVLPPMKPGFMPKAPTPKVMPRTMNDLTVQERF